jgi:hypothetical protein
MRMDSAIDTPSAIGIARDRSSLTPFLVYVAAFHVLWIAWPFFLYPRLMSVGNTTLTYAVLNLSFRFLYWIAPVLLYLRYVDGVNPFEYLRMTRHVRRGVIVALVLTVVNVLGTFARFGPPHLSMQRVTWNSVFGTSLFVGFIEEIPIAASCFGNCGAHEFLARQSDHVAAVPGDPSAGLDRSSHAEHWRGCLGICPRRGVRIAVKYSIRCGRPSRAQRERLSVLCDFGCDGPVRAVGSAR